MRPDRLSDPLREECVRKITEIVACLENAPVRNQGLMIGKIGLIFSLFHYARSFNDQSRLESTFKLFTKFTEVLENQPIIHTYSSGLAGIGWVVSHLIEEKFINTQTDLLEEFDSVLEESVEQDARTGNLDFLHGMIGTGFYFLKRGEKGKRALARIIEELDKRKIPAGADGIKWLIQTTPDSVANYNLSLSHGIASIIVFLTKLSKQQPENEKALRLLRGAIAYLLDQRLPTLQYHSYFPGAVFTDASMVVKNSRLAWCYGDLGMGRALLLAGRELNDAKLVDLAIDILKMTTGRRTYSTTAVIDAGLCHGSSGIAHIYNILYRETSIEIFREATDHWVQHALAQARFPDGVAGFQAFSKLSGWSPEGGFLEGAAGIMLSLSTVVNPEFSSWDESLLLS